MLAASAGAPVALAGQPGAGLTPARTPVVANVARLEAAWQREREAARRLAEAIWRCEQAHADAVRRLDVLDALLASTKAALGQRGFLAGATFERLSR